MADDDQRLHNTVRKLRFQVLKMGQNLCTKKEDFSQSQPLVYVSS